MSVRVYIDIDRCDGCPFVEVKRTMGAGYAHNYYCTAVKRVNNKLAGYVEYNSEIPTPPSWCPFRKENENAGE